MFTGNSDSLVVVVESSVYSVNYRYSVSVVAREEDLNRSEKFLVGSLFQDTPSSSVLSTWSYSEVLFKAQTSTISQSIIHIYMCICAITLRTP